MSDDESDCGCGRGSMCGGFFNPFSMLLGSMLMGAYHDDYDPWANRREKSAAAQSRENYAVAEFYSIKSVVEKVMLEKAKVVSDFEWLCCRLLLDSLLTL